MEEYTNTDQQLHRLSQVIAKANRTFVAIKEDDSHTNLAFDSLGNRIMGHWIDTPNGKIMLTLNLSSQIFEWINQQQDVLGYFDTIGLQIDSIEEKIASSLSSFGLNAKGFTDKLHYEIPEYSFMKDPVPNLSEDDLLEWANYRLLANEACSAVLTTLGVDGEIRIWPHHFDTGIYVSANETMGIGFGLAMEDQMAGAPYLYMSGYPTEGKLDFDAVTALPFGRWEIGEYWNGAILPLNELAETPYAGGAFIVAALDWYLG